MTEIRYYPHFDKTPFLKSLLARRPLRIYARVAHEMAQFFLKIVFLAQHMGTNLTVKMTSRYGLHL